jgi:hypothetical protein
MALLYFIGSVQDTAGLVHLQEYPGFGCIGTGYSNAWMWLNYRGQNLAMSIRRSALHAYEASRMASNAPTVNDRCDGVVASTIGSYRFSEMKDAPANACISLAELKRLVKRFGPKNTGDIGFTELEDSPNLQPTTGDLSHPHNQETVT